MLLSHVILCALIIACDALSIGTVTEKVKEPDAEGSDFFPDWVPFKNKHGEDLGEFVQVPKAKLKKRLALPVNFVLKAVAEPEGDDYLEKGQGESDNEEYYEKKDWSDAQRAAQPSGTGATTNHTEISDIDGVVEIITKKPDIPIVKTINNIDKPNTESKQKVEKEEPAEEKLKDDNKTEENKSEEAKKEDGVTKSDDDTDYDETSSESPKTDNKDQTESEAKKAIILSSVDELKERHAEEQRLISEKVKEEEMIKEERERENMEGSSEEDKYTPKKKVNSIEPDYEEYDENDSSLDEKYHVTTSSTSATPPQRTTKRKNKNKDIQIGKLSVFKNPDLFTVGNENNVESSTTLRPTHTWPTTAEKYSAKYRTATPTEDKNEIERISLLPENDTDSEEPTLFFPKKTKNRRRKTKTITPATDSYVAESVADKTAKHLSTTVDTGSSATTAVTAEAANSPEHGDAVSASTHHDKQEEKTEDYDNERGGGRDYHSHREEDHEEHGKKAYEGFHEDTKTAKGHRDKENHHGEYDDHGGVKEEHHDESGHYGSHHHEEHGKKHAKYEESGKHAKGHSTKGSHDIHKKEEYEKKVEFFEEEGDSGEEEKHGGHHEEREHKEGGHYKKGDLESGHHQHAKGQSGHFIKGGHQHVHKGHKASGGHDGHGSHGHDEHHKADRSGGKKWVYHHGHPAKTANLILVDRRFDKYSHGPYYYG